MPTTTATTPTSAKYLAMEGDFSPPLTGRSGLSSAGNDDGAVSPSSDSLSSSDSELDLDSTVPTPPQSAQTTPNHKQHKQARSNSIAGKGAKVGHSATILPGTVR